MRIGVDARAFSRAGDGHRQARGIARYGESLLAAMRAVAGGDHEFVLGASRRLANAAAAVTGRPRLDRRLAGPIDVLWLPAPAPVAVSAKTPYVLTVHDLAAELRGADFTAYARLWERLADPARLARGAAAVMAVSADTRAAAVERWKLDPGRVTVVRSGVWRPPGASADRVAAVGRELGLPPRYLLYVGALEPRKGIGVLLEAYARARADGLQAGLVLAGDGPLRDTATGAGVVRCGRVTDEQLAALYAGARATVLPSLLEGFGFTPLESLAAGTPAVASDLPALRETLGPRARLVPPGDAAALAAALVAVDRDEAVRTELLAAGRDAVAALSWERAAAAALDLFDRAAGGR